MCGKSIKRVLFSRSFRMPLHRYNRCGKWQDINRLLRITEPFSSPIKTGQGHFFIISTKDPKELLGVCPQVPMVKLLFKKYCGFNRTQIVSLQGVTPVLSCREEKVSAGG